MPDEETNEAKLPAAEGLQAHEHDRGLDLTLRSSNGSAPRTITIREPSIVQLGEVQTMFAAVDKKSPKVPDLDDDGSNANAVNDAITKRRAWVYGGTSGKTFPYADALLATIKLLAPDEKVTLDDLPSWTANPVVCQSVLNHFTLPLVGRVGQSAT